MKTRHVFFLLLVVLATLFISGCNETDSNNPTDVVISDPDDITSAVADWLLVFGTGDYEDKTENAILLNYLKATDLPLYTDVFTVEVNGVSLDLQSFMGVPGLYYTTYNLTEGATYTIVLKKNGTQILSTSQKMVYGAEVTFPNTYDPTTSAPLSWTLPDNNQYQFAGISSFKSNYPDEDDTDEYFVQLPVTSRSYTIQANAVDDFGAETEYSLGVEQLNYHITNRIAVMSFYEDFESYGGVVKSNQTGSLLAKAKALHQAVNR
jgi:hypothetical protein